MSSHFTDTLIGFCRLRWTLREVQSGRRRPRAAEKPFPPREPPRQRREDHAGRRAEDALSPHRRDGKVQNSPAGSEPRSGPWGRCERQGVRHLTAQDGPPGGRQAGGQFGWARPAFVRCGRRNRPGPDAHGASAVAPAPPGWFCQVGLRGICAAPSEGPHWSAGARSRRRPSGIRPGPHAPERGACVADAPTAVNIPRKHIKANCP